MSKDTLPTPLTDAEALKWGPYEGVMNVVLPADFARSLERSLIESQARVEGLERELRERVKPYYLQVGKYSIGNHPAGGYWLEHESGEGMQSGERFEEAVHEFYKQNF